MNKDIKKQKIKFTCVVVAIILFIFIAIFTVVKYEVEGEKKLPFNLGKIIIISSATTEPQTSENIEENVEQQEQKQEESYLWKENVIQTNDIYIYLDIWVLLV